MKRALLILSILAACGDDPKEPLVTEVYAATYVEVRNCRPSGDHDLENVRIVATPNAVAAYQGRDQPFPEGSIIVKEQYDFGDGDCSGDIVQWTAMRRLAEGTAPDRLDWLWQRLDADRNVVSEDESRCFLCHNACVNGDVGFAGTCAEP